MYLNEKELPKQCQKSKFCLKAKYTHQQEQTMSSPNSTTSTNNNNNNNSPLKFRSLKDQLRFFNQRDHLVEEEKDARRHLIALEVNRFNNLLDTLVRSNIIERQKDSERRTLCAREAHFRISLEEERLAWCIVIEDLMREYEQQIVHNERARTGKWKSVRIPHQKSMARLLMRSGDDELDDSNNNKSTNSRRFQQSSTSNIDGSFEYTRVLSTNTLPLEDDKNNQKQHTRKNSEESGGAKDLKFSTTQKQQQQQEAPSQQQQQQSSMMRKSQIGDKSKKNNNNNNRPNPFISMIQRDETTHKIPDIVKKRIDDMLVTHSKRNVHGTFAVERSAEKVRQGRLAMAKSRSESVRAASLRLGAGPGEIV